MLSRASGKKPGAALAASRLSRARHHWKVESARRCARQDSRWERPERSHCAILCSQTEFFRAGSTANAVLWLHIVRSPLVDQIADGATVTTAAEVRGLPDGYISAASAIVMSACVIAALWVRPRRSHWPTAVLATLFLLNTWTVYRAAG